MPAIAIAINDLPELDKPVALYGAQMTGEAGIGTDEEDWLVVVVAVLNGG